MNGARAIFKNKQMHLGSPGTPQKTDISRGDGLFLRVINGTMVRTEVLTFCGTACYWRHSRVYGICLDRYRGGKSVGYTFKITSHESTVQTCEGSVQAHYSFQSNFTMFKIISISLIWLRVHPASHQPASRTMFTASFKRVEWKEHAFLLSPGTINIS